MSCRYILIFFYFSLLLLSCSRNYNKELLPPRENIPPVNAKTIAVLPFENNTDNKALSSLVRNSFYSHLAIRAFNDVELAVVDKTLHGLGIKKVEDNDTSIIKKLGKLLGADYLVFGRVNANKKIYLALYSLNSIEAEINIVDSETCKSVWIDNIIFEKHDGGLPTSFLSIPFISFSSGMNVKDDTTFMLVENACRLLAYRIPTKIIGNGNNRRKYFLQAGAFINNDKAVLLFKKLSANGYKVFLKHLKIKGAEWSKVLLGPFDSREEANRIKADLYERFKIKTILKSF